MKYLNLSKGFNPYQAGNFAREEIEFVSSTFPGGEPHINISKESYESTNPMIQYGGPIPVTITHRINSFNDLGLLLLAVDALKHLGCTSIHLFIPYFPGARQDRVCNEGEGFASAMYVNILDDLGLESITSFDLHSDVVGGMFATANMQTKFIQLDNHSFVQECFKLIREDTKKGMSLIIPDAGAIKKSTKLSQILDITPIKCDKTRDVTTGKLSGFEVYTDDLGGDSCIIVDDICDGGGTFLGLAKELKAKGAGDLYLIVSHGIFSKGPDVLTDTFKKIYFTDSIWTFEAKSSVLDLVQWTKKLKQIKFKL